MIEGRVTDADTGEPVAGIQLGTVVDRMRYNAYGEMIFLEDDGTPKPAASVPENPYDFNGRRLDSETGLYYYRNRYYDPKQGRFISRDPRGIWGNPANLGNPKVYVGNRSLQFTAPSGME